MPGINGIEFLKILMSQYPIPTIVISGTDGRCFEAISAGAVGFVEKPNASTMNDFYNDLASKIKEASVAKLEKKYSKTNSSQVNNSVHKKRTFNNVNISSNNDTNNCHWSIYGWCRSCW